jgi:hypothetical protein
VLVAARLSVASRSSGVDAAVRRWPIRPSMPARSWHTAMQSSIYSTLAKIHGHGRAWESV